jgi:hypothetical protein
MLRCLSINRKSTKKTIYYLLRDCVVREGGLVRVPLLAELHVAEEERGGDHLEDGVQLLVRHAHHLSTKYIRDAVQRKKERKQVVSQRKTLRWQQTEFKKEYRTFRFWRGC